MNNSPSTDANASGRLVISAIAAAVLLSLAPAAQALGLGRLQVQSALGEPLRAEVDVTSISAEEAASLRLRVASPEAFRAAGVDYNAVLPGTQVQLLRRGDGRPYLRLASDRAVQEPFVDLILEMSWASGRLVREYTMLFDPPGARPPPPVLAATPTRAAPASPPSRIVSTEPPVERQDRPARPAPIQSPRAATQDSVTTTRRVPRAAAAEAAPPTEAPQAAQGAQADQYRVRNGDTLFRVATQTQRRGVSLDQMLVALYRSNPQAFIGNNMNRLRADAVLTVPSAEAIRQTEPAEARRVIQAQSADFGAYRHRLAGVVPAVPSEGATRRSAGTVQTEVEDRRAQAAATPDRLRLSQGSVQTEAKLSRDAELRSYEARVAELQRNIDELRRLTASAPQTAPAATVAGATTPAPGAAAAPGIAAAPAASAIAAAGLPAASAPPTSAAPSLAAAASAATASASAVAAAASSVGAAASAAVAAASAAAAATAAASAAAPMVVAAASAPRAASAPPALPVPAEEPGPLAALLDNPLLLPGAGLIVALLVGLGLYRRQKAKQADAGETSFLESRLQPDSFFDASGGQRVDTHEAAAPPSQLSSTSSYSLSQLDAIGDVDPVAEADVYLAYGRDLQAEEILKEALRSTPDRQAVRLKLLEVYAKRRDVKALELLATQVYSMTKGQGPDWAAAQEIGRSIDDTNPLYQPGGQPQGVMLRDGEIVEQLAASTLPASVKPSSGLSSSNDPARKAMDLGLDLDLDLDTPDAAYTPPNLKGVEKTQPFSGARSNEPSDSLSFDLPDEPKAPPSKAQPAARPPVSDFGSLDFDLSSFETEDAATRTSRPAPGGFDPARSGGAPRSDFGGLHGDPLERKLELADEFRQIGDIEGARDLLEEVIAKADGALKSKAQGMLAKLA